jgi:tetratricopeptide (TPR) repeat protein
VPALALLVLILLMLRFSVLTENIGLPPSPTIAHDQLAVNFSAGRVIQALYQIEAQAAQTGWTPELQRQAGELWRDAGDLPRAVAFWEAASASDFNNADLARKRAESYITLQRWTEAADALEQLLMVVPGDSWGHYQLGLIRAPFDPQTATAHLQVVAADSTYGNRARAILAVLLDNPDDLLISMRVGIAFADNQLWPYAELAFRHAAVVAQPFPEALAYVGLARDMQGKDGTSWVEQALALDADSPQVLYLHGLHLRTLGDYQQSLTQLIEAATLEPQNPAFLAELGTAYRLVNDLPSAEYWLKTAAALSPGNPHFQELLALFYAEEGYNLTSGGLDTLEQAARLMPDDPDILAGYGWALYTTGDTEAALLQLDAALAILPSHLRSLYYKAQIALESGNLGQAEALFEQVAASDSEFSEEARRVLQRLRE